MSPDPELAFHRRRHRWYPMSFSPLSGLAYVNTSNIGVEYEPLPVENVKNMVVGERSGGNTVRPPTSTPIPTRAAIWPSIR
jgi:hypothetical protein